VPRPADYEAIAGLLRAEGIDASTDAIAVLPPWSLRPYQYLTDLSPISGDDLAQQPLDRYRRLFTIVEPDSDQYMRPLVNRLGKPASIARIGALELDRFELPARDVRFDFRRRIAAADITLADVQTGRRAAACDHRILNGYGCGGRPWWQRVDREWLYITANGDEAIWAHPPPLGERLEILFADVTLGARLVLRAGFTPVAAAHSQVPLRFTVRVDDVEADREELRPIVGYRALNVDTRRWRSGTHRVTFVTQSEGPNRYHHFAFDAYTVDP